ncbi:MAG: phosphatidate cytidylyltransferase [Burkholderiales bacterium]|nr:phosphatidate cytidylyltransferase [Burkholderiales bacterium]
MLKQRILTAIVLLAILLPALFYPSHVPFACVMLVLIGAGAWEWGRLNGYGQRLSVFLGVETVALCALSWWLGLLDLWVAWLAAVQARMVGINFLLSILVLVWVADVFAYFAGRAFGLKFTRSKLAPAISPGKSWEGVWGGMVGVVVLAFAWVWADRAAGATVASLYTRLYERGWWLLLIGVLFLAAISVVGDLVESLIKRSAGAKDSSSLLPGHGGVLDRVDALLPALPIAMMLAFL